MRDEEPTPLQAQARSSEVGDSTERSRGPANEEIAGIVSMRTGIALFTPSDAETAKLMRVEGESD